MTKDRAPGGLNDKFTVSRPGGWDSVIKVSQGWSLLGPVSSACLLCVSSRGPPSECACVPIS